LQGGQVVDLLRPDDDPHLAPGLQGVTLLHAGEGCRQILQRLDALDVGFQAFPAGAGPRAADGVGGLHDHRLHAALLFLVVVGGDAVDDLLRRFVAAGQFRAERGVGAFHVVVDGLADVMQQAAHLGHGDVRAQLGGDDPGDVGGLDGMGVLVLAVAAAELELADQLDQLRVQAGQADLVDGALAFLQDHALDFLARIFHQLLDAGRVDAAVNDQLGQRPLGDLAAHGVEAADGDGFRRVVDDDIDAGRLLKGADVAPVAADDPALHLIGG